MDRIRNLFDVLLEFLNREACFHGDGCSKKLRGDIGDIVDGVSCVTVNVPTIGKGIFADRAAMVQSVVPAFICFSADV